MYRIQSSVGRAALLALVVSALSAPALAAEADITIFGGVQRQGKLTIQSSPGTALNLIRTIDTTNFGVFGARVGHGRIFGSEHTLAFSPNFIDAGTKALLYNSDVLVQAPLPVLRPYATAGMGLIHTSGDGLGVFGSKFAVNYGGGVKVFPAGPVGLRLDVRGYTVPSVEFKAFATDSQRIDFLEASFGLVFKFGE